VWIQLVDNQWTYFATHSDTVTTLWGEKDPGDIVFQGVGKLRDNCGCKGVTTSVLLETSCNAMSNVTLQRGDLLTQNCTSVTVVKNWV